jgi:type III restriction enzyme
MKPKGGHLVANDIWKEKFLLRIKDESVINFSTQIGDYRIRGLPFFTEQNKQVFDSEFKKNVV